MFLIVALFILPAVTAALTSPVKITALPDGVSITGEEPLRQVVATWNIYMTLEAPPRPTELITQVRDLDNHIAAVGNLRHEGIVVDMAPFKAKQQRMLALLQEGSDRRVRRGLFDVGGMMLNSLFGVATSDQLNNLKATLTDLAGSQQEIAHSQQQLATFVNQTRKFVNKVALQQHEIEKQYALFGTALRAISTAMNQHAKAIHTIHLEVDLDRYMDVLQMAVDQYVDQMALHRRQRRELESGTLSRALLKAEDLRDILDQASTKYQVINSLEWYYSFLSVVPLWQNTDSLVFTVEIPLVASRPYLYYNIMTHPVPLANDSYAVALKLEKHYALDTTTGNLFVPHKCIGVAPLVCLSSAEYDSTAHRCARGILTNRQDLVEQCQVTVSQYTGESIIKMIGTNQYALATQGETMVMRCPGTPESHVTLPRGCHNVTCLMPCRLSGSNWHISCIDVTYITRVYRMPRLMISKHFGFSTNSSFSNSHDATLVNALSDIENINNAAPLELEVMSLISSPRAPRKSKSGLKISVMSIVNISLILLFWVVLGVFYLLWRRELLKVKARHRQQPEEVPLRITAPVSEDQPSRQTPEIQTQNIWPVIKSCFASIWTAYR
jgi:hypothetical protein